MAEQRETTQSKRVCSLPPWVQGFQIDIHEDEIVITGEAPLKSEKRVEGMRILADLVYEYLTTFSTITGYTYANLRMQMGFWLGVRELHERLQQEEQLQQLPF